MSTADLLGQAETSRPDPGHRRLLRTAGLGGVGAFIAWLGQPVVVSLMAGDDDPTYAAIRRTPFLGLVEGLIFAGIGAGMLFLVLSVWRLVGAGLAARGESPSTAATVGHALGVVGACSWFLTAADSYRLYTSVGHETRSTVVQEALVTGTNQDVAAVLLLFVLGFVAWTGMLVTVGRRSGAVGNVAFAFLLPVLGLAATLARPFAPPLLPLIGFVVASLALGISFLLRARK